MICFERAVPQCWYIIPSSSFSHFEINFVSYLPDSIKHFEFLHLSFMVLGSNNYIQLKTNLKTDKINGDLS